MKDTFVKLGMRLKRCGFDPQEKGLRWGTVVFVASDTHDNRNPSYQAQLKLLTKHLPSMCEKSISIKASLSSVLKCIGFFTDMLVQVELFYLH